MKQVSASSPVIPNSKRNNKRQIMCAIKSRSRQYKTPLFDAGIFDAREFYPFILEEIVERKNASRRFWEAYGRALAKRGRLPARPDHRNHTRLAHATSSGDDADASPIVSAAPGKEVAL
jgi:hypothetical protein